MDMNPDNRQDDRSVRSARLLVRWRPVAKNGFDLPASQQLPRIARQLVSMGETYDFEYLPKQPGSLRLELRQNGPHHRLLFRVPIRVE